MVPQVTPRQRYLSRHKRLLLERSPFEPAWQSIGNHILPYRIRFHNTDANKAHRHNPNLVNSSAVFNLNVTTSGIMEGASSPARPWFRLGPVDPGLLTYRPAQQYFHTVEEVMREFFGRSNWYNNAHTTYRDIAGFGTASMLMEEDMRDGIRSYSFPIGRYALGLDSSLRVDSVYREISMTVWQVIKEFGLPAVSRRVKMLYERGAVDERVDILHLIEPNDLYVPGRLGPGGMPWKSVWLELQCEPDQKPLRESGYYEFPNLAPRWDVIGEDTYGIGPGWIALGDAKALQQYEKRKAKLVDKLSDPPTAAPSSLMNRQVSMLPGGLTYVDAVGSGQKVYPIHEIPPQALPAVENSLQAHERRIADAMYARLWLTITNSSDTTERTAKEIAAREEEKLLQLGPMVTRLHSEFLKPAVLNAYSILNRIGALPRPPPEIAGMEMTVDFISTLTQAQKLIGAISIERGLAFIGQMAGVFPNIVDNVDADAAARRYFDATGVPPDMLKEEDQVMAERRARAEQQMQAEQTALAVEQAKAGKMLSESDLGGNNALTQLMAQLRGAGASV